jgi:ABC-type sugar transport system ATPase subunit
MNRLAQKELDKIESGVNPKTLMKNLSTAEAQLVEIARALSYSSDIIILDEPTSSLSNHEIEKLFSVLSKLKEQGITIIYISHKLEEIFRISDRITVMRDGTVIGTSKTREISREEIIEMMVGRSVENEFPPMTHIPQDEIVLSVKSLMLGKDSPAVSFDLRKGEVLGFSGLVGSGRTELVKALFGADKKYKGEITIKGKPAEIKSPADAIKHGISLLTESRAEGIVYQAPVTWNTTFANIKRISRGGIISFFLERKVTAEYVKKLNTKTPSLKQRLLNLSGGNQQKVILSKWLFTDSDILILDEPTRGIDVGAKYEIYQLINTLSAEGKSIIFISSELPEVLAVSDRILVMAAGRVTALLEKRDFSPEKVMEYAVSEEGR